MRIFASVIALTLAFVSAVSFASSFREGVHYIHVDMAASESPNITFFHSPYCGPCAMVHEPIINLASTNNIRLREVIVAMGPAGECIQQGYVVANRQNKAHSYIRKLIRRIHFTRDHTPKNRDDISQILEESGVEVGEFDTPSQCVINEVNKQNQLVKQYQIRQTPTIIVNGNKQIVLPSLKNMEELRELILKLYNR